MEEERLRIGGDGLRDGAVHRLQTRGLASSPPPSPTAARRSRRSPAAPSGVPRAGWLPMEHMRAWWLISSSSLSRQPRPPSSKLQGERWKPIREGTAIRPAGAAARGA